MRTLPGINIQWPWSDLLLSGQKVIETRSYPLPEKYRGQPLAVIETPGPRGKKEADIARARIIGVITFSESKRYKTKSEWRRDFAKHRVAESDLQFSFKADKEKWGWIVASFERFSKPVPAPAKKGIVFATACQIP